MKKTSLTLFLSCLVFLCFSQTIKATYSVSNEVKAQDEDGVIKTVATIKYEAFYYRKDSAYISFLKPLYLKDYPDGSIDYSAKGNNYRSVVVSMDSMQYIEYTRMDSLLIRTRINSASKIINQPSNQLRKFEPNYMKWELLPETKTIQGLKCQRAKWIGTNGALQYDVWFCDDIPTDCNVYGLIGLPGLVIEGERSVLHQKFSLQSYQLGTEIDNAVFWPKEFNEPFLERGPIRKRW